MADPRTRPRTPTLKELLLGRAEAPIPVPPRGLPPSDVPRIPIPEEAGLARRATPYDALAKSESIGAPRIGDRYDTPTYEEITASDQPIARLLEVVAGPGRAPSVAAQDPEGIQAWMKGAGPMPAFLGTTKRKGGKVPLGAHAKQLIAGLKSGDIRGPFTADRIRGLLDGLTVAEAPKVAKHLPIEEGLGHMGKILTAGERGERGTRRRYPFAPAARERAEQIYHIGTSLPQRAEWADMTDAELLHAFENDPEIAKTYGSLWAGLSNQNPVPTNTREANQVWLYHLQHPENFPFSPRMLREFPHKKVNLSTSKYPNVNRAFRGEPLSGAKVGPMHRYMTGEASPFEVMTPDTHALYGSGVLRASPTIEQELPHIRQLVTRTERLKKGALTKDELVSIWQQSLYDVLHALDPDRKPDALFGDWWEGARAHKGQAFQGAVKDVLRRHGLLEYGAMLDKGKLLKSLRGWSAGSMAVLLGLINAEEEEQTEAAKRAPAAGAPPPPPF